jgi:hypothetical protein
VVEERERMPSKLSKRTPASGLALAIILVFLLFAIVAWVSFL